jgi:hypothetical protein
MIKATIRERCRRVRAIPDCATHEASARFIDLDPETLTLERLDHAFLLPEHVRIFEIGQQIVLPGV